MARTREFDIDEAVQKAMEVFWRRGYEGTSVQDLAEATGLGRGSLYAAFGSKQGLYELALQRYVRLTTDATQESLLRRVPLRQVLHDLLLGRIDDALTTPDRPGCLLVMAITERLPHDPTTKDIAHNAIKALQDSFRATLYLARSMGELPGEIDIPGLSDFLVTTIQGLRIMSAACPDKRILEKIVDTALSVFPW